MLNIFLNYVCERDPGKIFFILFVCRALKILSAAQILDCIFIFSVGQSSPLHGGIWYGASALSSSAIIGVFSSDHFCCSGTWCPHL